MPFSVRVTIVVLIILSFIFFFSRISSQTSFKTNSYVIQNSNGDLITVSPVKRTDSSSYDLLILKTTSEGESIWQKTIGGKSHEIPNFVMSTTDSSFLVVGSIELSNGDVNIWVQKIDLNGYPIWQKSFNIRKSKENFALSAVETQNGYYLISGVSRTGSLPGGYDFVLLEIDSNGISKWSKSYFGDANNFNPGFILEQNNVIITGFDFKTFKINLITKEIEWEKKFGSTMMQDFGTSILKSKSEDNLFLIGSDSDRLAMIEITTNGKLVKKRWLGTFTCDDCVYTSTLDKEGNIIFASSSKPGIRGDLHIIKTSQNGEIIWEKRLGVKDSFLKERKAIYGVNNIIEHNSGGYILSGFIYDKKELIPYIYIFKMDYSGNIIWEKKLNKILSHNSDSPQ